MFRPSIVFHCDAIRLKGEIPMHELWASILYTGQPLERETVCYDCKLLTPQIVAWLINVPKIAHASFSITAYFVSVGVSFQLR